MSEEERDFTVLWQKPLIEIEIKQDEIWIDDKLVWKNGEFIRRKEDDES